MDIGKTPRMLEIESEHGGKSLESILRDTYARTDNIKDAAEELGISYGTIRRWMIEYQIPMRRIAYTNYVNPSSPDRDTKLAVIRARKRLQQRERRREQDKVKAIGVHVYPDQHEWLQQQVLRIGAEIGIAYTMSDWVRDKIEEERNR